MNASDCKRRWQLALREDAPSELSASDHRLSAALSALCDAPAQSKRGGLGASSPRVARWLGDIREFFRHSWCKLFSATHLSG
jgi:hypothetical protein